MTKTIRKKKKCKKAKWLSEALQMAKKKRDVKGKEETIRQTQLNVKFQSIAKRDKKALSEQCKEILEENNRMGKTRDLMKKIRDTKGTFHAKMGKITDRNFKNLKEAERLRRGDKNTQKNCTKKILMNQITMMVWSLTKSQTSWSAKSSGPWKASL